MDHRKRIPRPGKGKGRIAGPWLAGLLLLGMAGAGWSQSLVTPQNIDRTLYRDNTRAAGMGNTYLIVIDDASGAAFNPALIARSGRYSFAGQAGAQTENLPIGRISQLLDALDDLKEQITAGGPGAVDAVQGAFNHLYEIAQNAGARPGSRATRIAAEADPLVALSYRNVGVLWYGGIAAVGGLGIGVGTGPNPDNRQLTISAGALSLSIIEIPYAFRTGPGNLGVGVKTVRAGYGGYAMVADASNNSIVGAKVSKTESRKVDLDVGYLSDPIPIKGVPGPGLIGAAVLRNIFSPEFSVPIEVRQVSGPPLNLPSRSDFRLNPQLDLGVGFPYKRLLAVAEVHNISATNAGDATFHLGGEYRLAKYVSLRAGYDDSRFVAGVGFMVGPVRLDVASATEPYKRASVGLSVRIQ